MAGWVDLSTWQLGFCQARGCKSAGRLAYQPVPPETQRLCDSMPTRPRGMGTGVLQLASPTPSVCLVSSQYGVLMQQPQRRLWPVIELPHYRSDDSSPPTLLPNHCRAPPPPALHAAGCHSPSLQDVSVQTLNAVSCRLSTLVNRTVCGRGVNPAEASPVDGPASQHRLGRAHPCLLILVLYRSGCGHGMCGPGGLQRL